MPVLCQLTDPDNYCPFDWELDERDRAYWLDLFAGFPDHIERHLREDGLGGEDFDARWRVFLVDYAEHMCRWRTDPARRARVSTVALGRFRQAMLGRHGWPDPYAGVKQRENDLAARMYPELIHTIDAAGPDERWDMLLKGLFAGNMFDLGSPETIDMYGRGRISFAEVIERIPARPWFIDDTDALRQRLDSPSPYHKVLFFVDNAGADICLGVVPVVREMARRGIAVVMAANSKPALNDITIDELDPLLVRLAADDPPLARLLADGTITTVASGNDIPLIDLSRVSEACDTAAAESDLIILEGMGRGVESNWRQTFRCDVWRVALIKDRTVARWLGCDVFEPVSRFTPRQAGQAGSVHALPRPRP